MTARFKKSTTVFLLSFWYHTSVNDILSQMTDDRSHFFRDKRDQQESHWTKLWSKTGCIWCYKRKQSFLQSCCMTWHNNNHSLVKYVNLLSVLGTVSKVYCAELLQLYSIYMWLHGHGRCGQLKFWQQNISCVRKKAQMVNVFHWTAKSNLSDKLLAKVPIFDLYLKTRISPYSEGLQITAASYCHPNSDFWLISLVGPSSFAPLGLSAQKH